MEPKSRVPLIGFYRHWAVLEEKILKRNIFFQNCFFNERNGFPKGLFRVFFGTLLFVRFSLSIFQQRWAF